MGAAITGATAVYGLVGDPVAHSLSPALHAAAFRSLGVNAVSVALRADASAAATVVDSVRRLGVRGLSVTMPLKSAVVAHCEACSTTVERLGAANCLTALDGAVRADSTDGDGLLDAVRCVTGSGVAGQRCVVVGAGGAARAAVEALGRADAAEVVVIARRGDAAEDAAALAPSGRRGSAGDVDDALVVVQATPVGMLDTAASGAAPLVDGGSLHRGQVAVDLVYHPRVTRWLSEAGSAGAVAVGGVEVLVHQAALALAIWLSADVPLAPLHEVARA